MNELDTVLRALYRTCIDGSFVVGYLGGTTGP